MGATRLDCQHRRVARHSLAAMQTAAMKPPIESRAEGLYCPAGDFFIDPLMPVPRAVVTHGHSDHARPGSGAYYCAAPGLPILRWRLGDQDFRPHDYRQVFELGRARVSLHPAGHILGSAQVRIESEGRVWVVSGDYKRELDPTCEAFEPLACDGFVTESTFALPVYRWPNPAAVVAGLLAWWDHCRQRGEAAVLFCYALGKAQRLLAELALQVPESQWPERPVFVHGTLLPFIEIYREAGVVMLPTQAVAEQGRRGDWAGALILAPPSAGGSPWMRRFGRMDTAFASGWMQIRGNRRRRGHGRGFVISDHADWPGLLQTIGQSRATQVLAMHGNSDALVRVLREQGMDVATLTMPGGAPS